MLTVGDEMEGTMVKRYDIWGHYDDLETAEQDNGCWVKYDDHEAELATLRAELAEWKEYGKDRADQLVKGQAAHLAEMVENKRLREALTEIATDPRDDSVCIGDGWNFYSDVVDYARQVLEGMR